MKKPPPIIKYDAFVKGVDYPDQMMSYYLCEHEAYGGIKKIFFYFLQMFMLNAHKL